MSKVDILIDKCENAKDETDEFWIKAYKEMQEIIKGDYPKEDKEKLLNLGVGEMILIIFDGISTQK